MDLYVDNLIKHHVWLMISLCKKHKEFYPETGNAKWKRWWREANSPTGEMNQLLLLFSHFIIPFIFFCWCMPHAMGYYF